MLSPQPSQVRPCSASPRPSVPSGAHHDKTNLTFERRDTTLNDAMGRVPTAEERLAALEAERQHMATKAELRATEVRVMIVVIAAAGIIVGAVSVITRLWG